MATARVERLVAASRTRRVPRSALGCATRRCSISASRGLGPRARQAPARDSPRLHPRGFPLVRATTADPSEDAWRTMGEAVADGDTHATSPATETVAGLLASLLRGSY